jgi:hypothetical protein
MNGDAKSGGSQTAFVIATGHSLSLSPALITLAKIKYLRLVCCISEVLKK